MLSLYGIVYFVIYLSLGWEQHLSLKQLSSIYDMVAGILFEWPRPGMGMKMRAEKTAH